MKLSARLACASDASELRQIALSRCVSSESGEKTGLIDYPVGPEEEYAERIGKGLVYLAEDYGQKKIAGFADAYLDSALDDVFPGDPVVAQIKFLESAPFAYINTIAVRKEYEARRVPNLLFASLKKDLPADCLSIWTAIVHAPLKNIGSSMLAAKWGFSLEKEMLAFEKYTFGLYRLSLK